MTSKIYRYNYDRQIVSYIGQFMRALSGFQIDTGNVDGNNEPVYYRVPVVYGKMDRVVASVINNKQDPMMNRRLPRIAVAMSNLDIDRNNKKPFIHKEHKSTDGKTDPRRGITSIIGPALDITMEAAVIAGSTDEMLSIIEQILLVFNPRITIRVSTNGMNSNAQTQVSLESITDEISYPLGTTKQVVSMTLSFQMKARINYPYDDGTPFIEEINKDVFVVDDPTTATDIDIDGITDTITEEDLVHGG